MAQQLIINLTKQMKQALSEQAQLNLGGQIGQCRCQRKITSMRLALSLILSPGSRQVGTIVVLHRDINRLHRKEVQYKAFTSSWPSAPPPSS